MEEVQYLEEINKNTNNSKYCPRMIIFAALPK